MVRGRRPPPGPGDGGPAGACRRLVRSLRRLGATTAVLNPGVHPEPRYLRFADLVVTLEGDWPTYATGFTRPGWTARHPAERFCHLVHAVPEALIPLALRTARERGAAVCGPVTGGLPNPRARPTPVLTAPDD